MEKKEIIYRKIIRVMDSKNTISGEVTMEQVTGVVIRTACGCWQQHAIKCSGSKISKPSLHTNMASKKQ